MQVTQKLLDQSSAAGQQTLTYWPTLTDEEKAFVAAYLENDYSLNQAAADIGISANACRRLLLNPAVKKAVTEVQTAFGDIEHMNDKWVKAHLLRLMPMVMGDEPVPTVNSLGEQVEVRRFNPEVAMKIVEYVAPKNQKVEHTGEVTMITRRVIKAGEQ